jgi:peptidoglycan/LPS O-acetylase OafA/YrhL
VEAFFYALFPWLAMGLNRRTRLLLLSSMAMAAVIVVATDRVSGWHLIAQAQGLLGWANPLLWFPLFLLGICAYECQAAWRTAAGSWMLVAAVAGILAVVESGIVQTSRLLFCYALALPCIVLIVACGRGTSGLVRVLSNHSLVYLGNASYALYLLHRPLHEICSSEFWVYTLISIAVACVVHSAFEQPMRRLLKNAFCWNTSARTVTAAGAIK